MVFDTYQKMRAYGDILGYNKSVVVENMTGDHNPTIPLKAKTLFLSLGCTSKNTFELVSVNILGPDMCSVQKREAKACKDTPYIDYIQ